MRRLLWVLPASAALHLVSAAVATPEPAARAAACDAGIADAAPRARHAAAQTARRALVEEAAAHRRADDLRLGAFLLGANGIDAFEAGEPFDAEAAATAYATRLARFEDELRRGDAASAVRGALDDLHYAGIPGGRLSELLATGAGSCEQVSHLVVAALHDLGHGADVRLRFWGAPSQGATHLAPIWVRPDRELDLVAQRAPAPGGATFRPEELVDAYARTHHLSAPRAIAASAPRAGRAVAGVDGGPLRSMTAGYPDNGDRFEGALPLWSGRAIAEPSTDPKEAHDEPIGVATACAFAVPLGALDPQTVSVPVRGEAVDVELLSVPTELALERLATTIAEVEGARARFERVPAERAVGLGCLAVLYDRAALGFGLAGRRAIATRAAAERDRVREEGRAAIAALDLTRGGDAHAQLVTELAASSWMLLALPGGDVVTLELARDSVARTQLLTALLVHPPTRAEAQRRTAELDPESLVLLLHELWRTHARAHEAPPDAPPGGPAHRFEQAFLAFGPLTRALWVEPSTPSAPLDRFAAEARARGLDPALGAAVEAYYVRNLAWLHARRADADAVHAELDRWLRAHERPSLIELEPRLRESQPAPPRGAGSD